MKKLLFLACIVALAACGPAKQAPKEKSKSSLELQGLKGPVNMLKTVTVVYDYEADKYGAPRQTSSRVEAFNTDGMLTESVESRVNWEHEYRTEQKYDAENNLTELITRTGEKVTRDIREYKDGKVVAYKYYDDDDNLMGEARVENISPDVEKCTIRDKDGKELNYSVKTTTSPTEYSVENVYLDANGNELSCTVTVHSDNLPLEIREIQTREGEKFETAVKYTYDDNRNVSRAIRTINGEPSEETYMKYQYDELGNWIQRLDYDATTDKIVSAVNREIRYYY